MKKGSTKINVIILAIGILLVLFFVVWKYYENIERKKHTNKGPSEKEMVDTLLAPVSQSYKELTSEKEKEVLDTMFAPSKN